MSSSAKVHWPTAGCSYRGTPAIVFNRPGNGDYRTQFDIPVHWENHMFVRNQQQQGGCPTSEVVCYSLTHGAVSCPTPPDRYYTIQGSLEPARRS